MTLPTLLVTPTELILKPGEAVALTIRAFDASGRSVAAPAQATWTLEGLKGTVDERPVHARCRGWRAGRNGQGDGGIALGARRASA